MSCDNNCNDCSLKCKVVNCPICGMKGMEVPLITVKNLIKNTQDRFPQNIKSYICTNRKCDVIYFFESNPTIYTKNDVKCKVWFKSALNEQIICYCHNLKLNDIVDFVKSSEDLTLTKEKIFRALSLDEKEENCINKNPIGTNCDKLFKNAIEFAYKQKQLEGEK